MQWYFSGTRPTSSLGDTRGDPEARRVVDLPPQARDALGAMESAFLYLIDDDESLRRVTAYHLEKAGYELQAHASAEAALAALEAAETGAPSSPLPDLIITDVRMPGMDGLELLRRVKERWPALGVIVVTAMGSIQDAVEAMRQGAHDYLVKPFEHEVLRLSIQKGLRLNDLLRENKRLRALAGDRLRFENMVATSSAMDEVLSQAAQVAPGDTTLLLLGESGTGKELLARAIHHASSRRDGPFVAVGTGALPDTLVDSELFGHRRGAFTGADKDRPGKFELADGGTIFLDEIGELKPELQVKLLRVLQEREIDPLGGRDPVQVDVRVIAATHRNLEEMVADGSFREDLYYRLAVVPLTLPPLRERPEDVGPLALHFLGRLATAQGRPSPEIDPGVLERLADHLWPGNVRELSNVMERALALHPEGPIGVDDLPPHLRGVAKPRQGQLYGSLPEGGLDLSALEREIISRALVKHEGNRSATARYLGITRNTLNYRVDKFELGD